MNTNYSFQSQVASDLDQGCNTHSKAIRKSFMFNPDLRLHMPEHTLAALAGTPTVKFNSKELQKIQYSRWNLKHRRTQVSAASHPPLESP